MHNGGTVSNENYSVEVPYEIINGQIILKIFTSKNSKDTLNFLFDTGSYSGVSLDVYQHFSGDFANLRTNRTDGNRVTTETEIYSAEELYIGELLIEDFNLAVDEYVNENLDGIIGSDFIEDKVITFDFPKNKLIISDILPDNMTSDYQFNLTKDWSKLYSAKINLEEQKMKFVFDTGRTGFLETSDKLKIMDNNHSSSYEIIGRDAKGYRSVTVTYIQTKNLAFGKNNIDNAIIIKSSDYSSNFLETKILMENKVILDCMNMQMILKLADDKIKINTKQFPTHSFAFGWLEGLKVVSKKVEVLAIDLELFDEIIEINGTKTLDSEEKVGQLLNSLKNEKIWYLKIRRGDLEFDVQVPPSIVVF